MRLTPGEVLVERLGAGSPIARAGVAALYGAMVSAAEPPPIAAGRFGSLVHSGKAAAGLAKLASCCGLAGEGLAGDLLLAAVDAYFALVVRLAAGHVLALARRRPSPLATLRAARTDGQALAALVELERGDLLDPLLYGLSASKLQADGCHGHARGAMPRERAKTSHAHGKRGHGTHTAPFSPLAGRGVGGEGLSDAHESDLGGSGNAASDPWSWYLNVRSGWLGRWIRELADLLPVHLSTGDAIGQADRGARRAIDWLGPLQQSLLPKSLRHALGQYYTPGWLAADLLDQTGGWPTEGSRLLDPCCGSGVFLLEAIGRLLPDECGGRQPDRLDPTVFRRVVGFDVDPLAVMAARANWLLALGDLLPEGPIAIPIHRRDVILDPPDGDERFDVVVGNPPWVAWDHLPAEYRRATRPLWEHYGLFSLSGTAARHGGAKKDLAMLVLYAAADRYLADGGRLGFVIPQSLLQSKGAGDGFRRFRLGKHGAPLGVVSASDLVRLRPFAGTANWTATIVLVKGQPTEYPVPYTRWEPAEQASRAASDATASGATGCLPASASNSSGRSGASGASAGLPGSVSNATGQADPGVLQLRPPGAVAHRCLARPIDPGHERSPWLVLPADLSRGVVPRIGASDYTAHLGANTGGANGVYWLEVLGAAAGGVVVRNLAGRGKRAVAQVTCVVEPDLLYPLVRWADVARYRAAPSAHLLLVQDVHARRGIDESRLRRRWPRTLAYLEPFRELLASRAAYRRYQHAAAFYSMYNVGAYTLAPWKVVWRRMDRRINAAVLGPVDDPVLGTRPAVVQETCVQTAVDSPEEAHYLAAMLNSEAVGLVATAHGVDGGKGFGTPGMLDFLALGRFDPVDGRHRQLAAASREAHRLAAEGQGYELPQRRIDGLAATLRAPGLGEGGDGAV